MTYVLPFSMLRYEFLEMSRERAISSCEMPFSVLILIMFSLMRALSITLREFKTDSKVIPNIRQGVTMFSRQMKYKTCHQRRENGDFMAFLHCRGELVLRYAGYWTLMSSTSNMSVEPPGMPGWDMFPYPRADGM